METSDSEIKLSKMQQSVCDGVVAIYCYYIRHYLSGRQTGKTTVTNAIIKRLREIDESAHLP